MLRGAAAISKLNMAFGASGLYSDILQGFAREDPDLLPYDKPIVLKKYFDPNDASSLFIYRPSGYTVEKTGTGIIYRNSDGDPEILASSSEGANSSSAFTPTAITSSSGNAPSRFTSTAP